MHRNLATRVQCGILAILCLAGTAAHGQTTRNASPWLALNAAQVEAALAKAAKASGEFDRLAAASAPAVMLETRPTKSIEATLDARYQASGYRGQTWLVYLPHAEDLPGQEGVSCKVLLPANATEAKEKSPLERAVYQATADTRSRPTDVLVTKAVYSADLQSRRLVPATAAGLKQTPPADPAKDFLAPSPTIDFHAPKFQAWLDQKRLHPAGGETDLAFARRVFVAIVSNEK